MRCLISVAALVVVATLALVASFTFGPLGRSSPTVLIDQRYLSALQLQYLFSGLLASTATGLAALALGVGTVVTATILLVCGVLVNLAGQLSEPDVLENLLPNLVEFLLPYAAVCALVLGALAGIRLALLYRTG